jgi:hypothetical protein
MEAMALMSLTMDCCTIATWSSSSFTGESGVTDSNTWSRFYELLSAVNYGEKLEMGAIINFKNII